jgi:large subunit ribosomal protein L6
MSRVGEKPIEIPGGVTVSLEGGQVLAKGPLGEGRLDLPEGLAVAIKDGEVALSRERETREIRSRHGLIRTLIANMVEGVSKGYSKALEIEGVGFRAAVQGRKVSLALGFAKPVELTMPEGIEVKEEGGTKVSVSGTDKQKVGDFAARIRGFFPAEPYKGKGIRYAGEQVKRKVGKTVA